MIKKSSRQKQIMWNEMESISKGVSRDPIAEFS